MLDSFLIRNFRLFEDLQIDHLSQVNLFVGKNNSGKSCLLEALQIYAGNARLNVLLDIIAAHDGNWEAEIEPESDAAPARAINPLSLLFHGFVLPAPGVLGIEVGSVQERTQRIAIQTELYQTVQDEEVRRRVQVSQGALFQELPDAEFWLVVKEAAKFSLLARIEGFDYRRYKRRTSFLGVAERDYRFPFFSVPAQSLTERQVASLWDKVSLTDLQSDVLTGLQLIHPKISGIAFLGETRLNLSGTQVGGRRVAVVRLSDSSERYPLKSMGDGLSRVLQITLALVNAKDGILLVDEFENGLHWTVQPKLWHMVFRLAKRLNVQVFATTHSQDCVKAFSSVWQDDEDTATFHRLDRDSQNGVKVTAYDRSTLSDSVETEVEVR
ncbi:MAG: AAA family ATPase [Terriglobia bacterium]|jgi:AAA15 family ATPase/GTPase